MPPPNDLPASLRAVAREIEEEGIIRMGRLEPYVALLDVAADALEKTGGAPWQPVATAPKDGTPILSWDGEQQAVIKWCGCRREWVLLEGENQPDQEAPIIWENVTMWAPLLPPPPAPEQATA